jgi:hypothetical protein
MFDRFFRRGPRIGSEVTVLVGPYAGYTGRVAEIDYNARIRVFIDDCCQPVLDATDLILGRPRNVDKALEARRAVERNPNREPTRAMVNARTAPTDKAT